jgi:aryl-alcohol dehydrogenase-like predicted oxidoreductase
MNVDLVLGTANFGVRYGISNGNQLLQEEEIAEIVHLAENSGLIQFDTAPAYGNAEAHLGIALLNPKNARVFTKIDAQSAVSVSKVMESANRSLLRTKVEKFAGIYLHDESVLFSSKSKKVVSAIRELLNSGITERVGISVYSIENAFRAKDICPELNLFQVAENICDRRLYHSEEMNNFSQEGNDVYIRSIFLQGLLLMELRNVPKEFHGIIPSLKSLIDYAKSLNTSREALCLAYVRQISWAAGIVVGVASLSQLDKLLEPETDLPSDFEKYVVPLELEFLDPRTWHELK